MPGPSREEPEDENEEGLTYKAWLARANKVIAEKLGGLSLSDLRDRLTFDAWEENVEPEVFAIEALAEEGAESGMDGPAISQWLEGDS